MQNMFDGLGFTLFRLSLKQVRHMQKTGSLETNVYESTLHPRQNPNHSSQVNIPHQAFGASALNKQILKNAVSHHCHSGFTRSEVD